jgi:hypothetical protein
VTYELKFNDSGLWMNTKSFVELVQELRDLGIDADTLFTIEGCQFTIKKSDR